MHPQAQSPTTNVTADQPPSRFIARLLDALSATIPFADADTPADKAECREFVRILFTALHPSTPIEAALAVRAIAAWLAAMDLFARAARPGIADDAARRLRGTANATGRAFDAVLRERARRHGKPLPAALEAEPSKSRTPAPRPPSTAPKHARASGPLLDPRLAPEPPAAAPGKHRVANQIDVLLAAAHAVSSASQGHDWRTALRASVALPAAATA